jgi:FkbM family methyltransferase
MKNIKHRILRKIDTFVRVAGLPGAAKHWLRDRNFSAPTFSMCQRLKASGVHPQTIFDVGANIGQFSLACCWAWPKTKIFAYEPDTRSYPSLIEMAKEYRNVNPMALALSSEEGSQTFHLSNFSESSSLRGFHSNHLQAYPDIGVIRTMAVPTSTLAAELTKHEPTPPALLKLDVQGAEAEVIQGAMERLNLFQWILLETSSQPMYDGEASFEELRVMLTDQNFHFCAPVSLHSGREGQYTQFDALFSYKK